jgi:hypothetical protein
MFWELKYGTSLMWNTNKWCTNYQPSDYRFPSLGPQLPFSNHPKRHQHHHSPVDSIPFAVVLFLNFFHSIRCIFCSVPWRSANKKDGMTYQLRCQKQEENIKCNKIRNAQICIIVQDIWETRSFQNSKTASDAWGYYLDMSHPSKKKYLKKL